MSLFIKKAVTDDAEIISEIGRKTFTESFGYLYSANSLRKYLNQAYGLEKLIESIQKDNNDYWLAEIHGKPVAFLKMKWNRNTDLKFSETEAQLQKIYVLQEHSGKGIGQSLLETAIAETERRKIKRVWLDVFIENPEGLRFYLRHGFKQSGKYLHAFDDFELEYDILVKDL